MLRKLYFFGFFFFGGVFSPAFSGAFELRLGRLPLGVGSGKRKNSLLTWEEDEELAKAVDVGVKPAQLRISLTKKAASELIGKGVDPLSNKEEQGGLTGTLRIEDMSIRCIGYVLPTIFCMYLACIHIIL